MNLSIIKIVNKIVKASKVSGYIVDPRSKDEELAAKEIKKYERKAARMIGRWAGVQVTGCLFYILQRNIWSVLVLRLIDHHPHLHDWHSFLRANPHPMSVNTSRTPSGPTATKQAGQRRGLLQGGRRWHFWGGGFINHLSFIWSIKLSRLPHLSTCFFQVADDSGDERVVEPQRTLPVHARCQVVMKTNMIIMVIVINDQGKKENQSAHDSHCQVLVVGGGPSGLSAALAARRAGAEVILMERLFIIIMIICNTL